jgi:hypothetical protein
MRHIESEDSYGGALAHAQPKINKNRRKLKASSISLLAEQLYGASKLGHK